MLVQENPVEVKPKKNLSYPVFAKYSSTGEIYMFLDECEALILKHNLPKSKFRYTTTVLSINSSDWEILPDGYSITLTQNQQG